MKTKALVFGVLFLVISMLGTVETEAVTFTSTLEFIGSVEYSGDGNLSVKDSNQLPPGFNQFYLVGDILYAFEWDLPDVNTVYDWDLDINLAGALTVDGSSQPVNTSETLSLGAFALTDHQTEIMSVINLLQTMPEEDYIPVFLGSPIGLYYYFDTANILDEGILYIGLTADVGALFNNADTAMFDFEGNIALNAHGPDPVPEPGTLALLGFGILGLAVVKRKKKKQTV